MSDSADSADRVTQKNPCSQWEFRWNKAQTDKIDPEDFHMHLIAWCKLHCADWGFQLETGAGGLVHYQGHIRLIGKKRDPWSLMPWDEKPNYFRPTCNKQIKLIGNGIGAYYATKTDTRTDGPWCHDPSGFVKQMYDCWDIGDKLSILQETIVDQLAEQGTREILFVHGNMGCVGKTTLGMWLLLSRPNVVRVPATMESAEDILQWVYGFTREGQENQATIILDVPRTVSSSQSWSKFLMALEDIKTGFVYDKRYSAKVKVIYPPRVLVFSNGLPKDGLTADRYVELAVDDFVDEIEPFKPPTRKRVLELRSRDGRVIKSRRV